MNLDYCWDTLNSGLGPQPVGQKVPNAYGLFDMSGECTSGAMTGTMFTRRPVLSIPRDRRPEPGGCCAELMGRAPVCPVFRLSLVKRSRRAIYRCGVPVRAGRVFTSASVEFAGQQGCRSAPVAHAFVAAGEHGNGYYVQVSMDSLFAAVVFQDTTMIPSVNSRTVNGLSGGVTYFWR